MGCRIRADKKIVKYIVNNEKNIDAKKERKEKFGAVVFPLCCGKW